MKSVTIKDKQTGKVLFKVIHKKGGKYEITMLKNLFNYNTDVDIRDDNNSKVLLQKWE